MKTIGWLFIMAALVMVMSCGGGGNKKDLMKEAKELFDAGQYEEALGLYAELIDTEGDLARLGAGWSALMLGEYTDAEDYFEVTTLSQADVLAGWALIAWSLDKPQMALDKVTAALTINAQYQSAFITTFDHTDLVWIQAASHLELNHYTECVASIKVLDANFNPDMNSPDLAQVLLNKLQELGTATVS